MGNNEMKSVLAVPHVHFEDLGAFASVFADAGYQIRYLNAGVDDLSTVDAVLYDLVVVLGGPIGSDEEDKYPFLVDELRIIDRRIEARRSTLGVCLGAQLIAARYVPRSILERRMRSAGLHSHSRLKAQAALPTRSIKRAAISFAGVPRCCSGCWTPRRTSFCSSAG